MFTGIVQAIGRVSGLKDGRLAVQAKLGKVKKGDSIAVDGVCLTVTGAAGQGTKKLTFDVSAETLGKTTLGGLSAGRKVNIEPALRAGDPLGGHFVLGHVEGTGQLVGKSATDPRTTVMEFSVPLALRRYLVAKGSVAVSGVSLTVVEVKDHSFTVAVVPHTAAATTFGDMKTGDPVNLETDIIAKHVEGLLKGAGEEGCADLFVKRPLAWDQLMSEEGYK